MPPRRPRNIVLSLGLGVLVVAVSGCASMNSGGSLSDRFSWLTGEPKPQQPGSVVIVWTDTILNTAGKVPVRGFGGRVMFFDHPGGSQVAVNGTLTVYAYDESDGKAVSNVPDRKFVYKPEQLKELYSKNDLGPSYSIWLPWDNVGGERKQISLLARFKSDSGAVTISEMTRQLLPGIAPRETARQTQQAQFPGAPTNGAVQVSYDQWGRGAIEPTVGKPVITRREFRPQRRRMSVKTIDLPQALSYPLPREFDSEAAAFAPQDSMLPLDGATPPPSTVPQTTASAWSAGGNVSFGQPVPVYPLQTSSLPSVWELAQQRAQQAKAEREQRGRPQGHSARPRPPAQASQFAQRGLGRDWSEPLPAGLPYPLPGAPGPTSPHLGQAPAAGAH